MNIELPDYNKIAVQHNKIQHLRYVENELNQLFDLFNEDQLIQKSHFYPPGFNHLGTFVEKKKLLEKHKIIFNILSTLEFDDNKQKEEWSEETDILCNEWTMWLYRCRFYYEFMKTFEKFIVTEKYIVTSHNKNLLNDIRIYFETELMPYLSNELDKNGVMK